VFDDLGIVDRVIANGRMAMPMRSTAPDGQVTVSDTETLGDRSDVAYQATLITPEWRIEALRLAEFCGTVEFGTVFLSLEQSDETVSALTVKGGETEAITATSATIIRISPRVSPSKAVPACLRTRL
jgi:hypothetical protein